MTLAKLIQKATDGSVDLAIKLMAECDTEAERQLILQVAAGQLIQHLHLSLLASVQIGHHVAGRWPDGTKGPFEEDEKES